ncbi:DUF6248 family natural product biosynthesis protein [Streptomyces sp. NBC_01485]|uniref:DUF6248 family natural product biosynthesis protein n=1 Tax=Streptomyces sp. NBC_01485 TaxID=2903884 RepID=UPI002E2FA91C|nr:DUF6248 family natural product biosynthesis protein [Streptomyces sp. NBC_01485]
MTAPISPPRRPQRKLTEAEQAVLAGVQALCFHRMLHLGLVDPVPNPSPMSEEEGAWVREQVWTKPFHLIDDGYAWGFWRWSFCEKGTCWNCLAGRCEWCMHRQKGGPDVCDNVDWVHNHRGRTVARLILRPGGEPCVWWCRCPCDRSGPPPAAPEPQQAEPEPVPAKTPSRPAPAIRPNQTPLF